jgi:DNA-binding transcriptional LysR family regulator
MQLDVDLRELRVFLALAEELHFARTAEQLGLSPSRVSQILRSLERKVGGQLLYRTSRQVELTTLGKRLQERLVPVYAELFATLDDVKQAATDPIGPLRIGFTLTTVDKITRVVDAFEKQHGDIEVKLREVSFLDPYHSLRAGQVDVLINWHAGDEPDLTLGPVIDWMDRLLAVAATHSLAKQSSVSVEDLADYPVRASPPGFPRAMYEALIPLQTPSGRPILRAATTESYTVPEIVAAIVRGEIVHPTVNVPPFSGSSNIVLVPIRDMPPLPLRLIWHAKRQTAAVHLLARVTATGHDTPPAP